MNQFERKATEEYPLKPSNLDRLGLVSWAAHAGISEHAAAIQMAAALSGAAGPVAFLDDGETGRRMSSLVPVLMTKGGRRPTSLEVLRSPVLQVDSLLRQRFERFSAQELWDTYRQMPKTRSHFASPATEADRMQQLQSALDPGSEIGGYSGYDRDWEPDALDRRMRSALRPGFVLEHPDTRKLSKLVGGCHDSVAFVPGLPLGQLLRQGHEGLQDFFAVAAGCEVELPPKVIGSSLIRSERGEVRAILTADPDDVAKALQVYPDFAHQVVLVDASRPKSPGAWEEGKVGLFLHLYRRQVQSLADRRRRGHLPDSRDWSNNGRRLRANNRDAFLAACDASRVPCAGLEDLPSILRWAFDLIARPDLTTEEELADCINRHCLALLDDHCQIMVAIQHRAARAQQLQLATRIVGKVAAKQPVRQRALIRTFDNQKVELYRPVLDLLVNFGVLVEDPGKVFRMGSQRFEDVHSRWFGDSSLPS